MTLSERIAALQGPDRAVDAERDDFAHGYFVAVSTDAQSRQRMPCATPGLTAADRS